MRLAPFALFALLALPACAPYGYGYEGAYATPAYGGPGPAYYGYGQPYYAQPAYVAPAAGGILLYGGDRGDRRYDDRRFDGRRVDDRRGNPQDRQRRPSQQARPGPRPAPQQRPAPAPQSRPGGGGGGHDPSFNPANPNASGATNR